MRKCVVLTLVLLGVVPVLAKDDEAKIITYPLPLFTFGALGPDRR